MSTYSIPDSSPSRWHCHLCGKEQRQSQCCWLCCSWSDPLRQNAPTECRRHQSVQRNQLGQDAPTQNLWSECRWHCPLQPGWSSAGEGRCCNLTGSLDFGEVRWLEGFAAPLAKHLQPRMRFWFWSGITRSSASFWSWERFFVWGILSLVGGLHPALGHSVF